ncbi:SH3 domain-containing protein [Streptomyces sp. ISL-12]|uniref:SH3 domain-containing protein n=1 Tax=Streptomyces sp. ISL-12 TaxID=2819177 RepID=UPI001BEA9F13|nr:SH3 domain-containing protein [Streptomyces sp. ISL-12]MBT2416118.1 SH3 domain-containing protein [Streptomyces sp. ISL-12]
MPNRPSSGVAMLAAGTLVLLAPLAVTAAGTATDAGPTAATAPAPPVGVGRDGGPAAPYTVEAHETADVRSGPARSYAKAGSVAPGRPRGAYCWTHGGTVTGNGRSDDVWVRLLTGHVSAVHLEGGPYGGLPASATC